MKANIDVAELSAARRSRRVAHRADGWLILGGGTHHQDVIEAADATFRPIGAAVGPIQPTSQDQQACHARGDRAREPENGIEGHARQGDSQR